jgi:arginase
MAPNQEMEQGTEALAGKCVVVGIPYDENSSFLREAAGVPARIREALHCGSANLSTELGVDLSAHGGWQDLGDLRLPPGPAAMGEIEGQVESLARQGARVLSLGGDHSISYPLLRAHARHYPDLTILHLDAHPDLYDELDGSRLSHACPFARIIEVGLCRRLVQVGIRTLNPHQRAQAARFGVEIYEARSWQAHTPLGLAGPLYLSLDMDVRAGPRLCARRLALRAGRLERARRAAHPARHWGGDGRADCRGGSDRIQPGAQPRWGDSDGGGEVL